MAQTILVTGASGKTGLAIIKALSDAGHTVSALTHKLQYEAALRDAGASSVFLGDLRSKADLLRVLHNQSGIYHICPNMTPDEAEIGKLVIECCKQQEVGRFVYHSVLHPQINEMPHHWQKMLVEQELFRSGLEYTVLQPTAYMQNILGYRQAILDGKFEMPYRVHAKISLVSLADVGEAVTKVFSEPDTKYGTFELVGTDPLSQEEVAQKLSIYLNRPVTARSTGITTWYEAAAQTALPEYSRNTLKQMFEYYDNFGLTGSKVQLTCLLQRKPITIEQFLQAEFIL